MDEKEIIRQILSAFSEIRLLNEEDGITFFSLYNNEYGLIYPSIEALTDEPVIIVKNNDDYNFPHIMLKEHPWNGSIYRSICLYESGSQIVYLKSFDEKILDIIERLLELLNLTPLEIEKEFQKEFLFYWNAQAKQVVDAYISSNRIFHKMNVYANEKGVFRFVGTGIKFNDRSKYTHIPNFNVYYIPIIDTRGILPPLENSLWKSADILKILKGRDYKRISSETYNAIKSENTNNNEIGLIFEMIISKQRITFGMKVRFRRTNCDNLLEKIENAIEEIIYLKINRCDYNFINSQIGNDTCITGKKIGIIGAGSLGSYIATELVKAGINKLAIYDPDIIEEANLFRHNVDFFCCGHSKVVALQYKLQQIHPEIFIDANKEYVTDKVLERDIAKFDMLIFSVGSSDVQLLCNRFLKKIMYDKPVLYVWLEAGGINSHIQYVNYSYQGCFQCLYTDENGGLINNKVNKMTNEQIETNILRNGCGATRVAYGTDILLRTTSAVLNVVKKVFDDEMQKNILIDIDKETIKQQGQSFIESRCSCCGDPDKR